MLLGEQWYTRNELLVGFKMVLGAIFLICVVFGCFYTSMISWVWVDGAFTEARLVAGKKFAFFEAVLGSASIS